MGSLLGRLFRHGSREPEDDALGFDMTPAPSVLSTLYDPQASDAPARPSAVGGPFTTMAQAPIRDS